MFAGLALGGSAAAGEPAAYVGDAHALVFRPDAVVAADGSGNFRTIQAALDSLPRDSRERRIIFIKDGTYNEKIRIDTPCVTLRGQSRTGTRLAFAQGANEFRAHPDDVGIGVVNINGDDCALENLTVENTHGVIGVHAFAVYGQADRTVIVDCDVLSQGNDTLSPWKRDGGRYYFARLKVRGSVDFICPRGWCYMADSDIYEVNPGAEAAIWHDGSREQAMKFVLRNCRFDGVDGWRLARHHHDAQFYLLDCTFSLAMRDLAPHRVIYPIHGGPPTDADRIRNQDLDATNVWGERSYFAGCHRQGGDYPWFRDNLSTAPGSPSPEQVTAAWTFAGTWDPERTEGPVIRAVNWQDGRIAVIFSERVTVKGMPQVRLHSGAVAGYSSGSGGDTLYFAPPGVPREALDGVDLHGGAIIASDAAAVLRAADLTLP